MNGNGIMLMFLSCDRCGKVSHDYHYVKDGKETDRGFPGIQTGDAPARFLLSAAAEDKSPIRKIICIVTKEDLKDKDKYGKAVNEEGVSTLERFKRIVADWCGQNGLLTPEVYPIELHQELTSQDRTRRLYGEIAKEINAVESDGNYEVYLDFTGGLRDVSYMMTAIIQYLQYREINCRRIIYSDFQAHRLYDLGYIYTMAELTSSVNEFLSTGNASRLLQVMHDSQTAIGSEPADETWIQELLKSIVAFSDALTLCNMAKLDIAAKDISKCLEKENKEEEIYNLYQEMFMTLIPEIKEKLRFKEGKISYPGLVQWCLDNRMLQQAATLYVEKMPAYYFADEAERALIPYEVLTRTSERIENGDLPGKDWETIVFYTDLFEYMGHDANLDELREAVRRLSNEPSLNIPLKKSSIEYNPVGEIRKLREDPFYMNLSDICKSALDRVESFVQKRIDPSYACDIYDRVCKLQMNMKSLDLFLAGLAKRDAGLYTFLYPEKEYEKPSVDNVYRRKYASVSRLPKDDKLRKRMLYYLAAKLIRNRMNHAAAEMKEDERILVNCLRDEGICYDGTVAAIHQILHDGVVN